MKTKRVQLLAALVIGTMNPLSALAKVHYVKLSRVAELAICAYGERLRLPGGFLVYQDGEYPVVVRQGDRVLLDLSGGEGADGTDSLSPGQHGGHGRDGENASSAFVLYNQQRLLSRVLLINEPGRGGQAGRGGPSSGFSAFEASLDGSANGALLRYSTLRGYLSGGITGRARGESRQTGAGGDGSPGRDGRPGRLVVMPDSEKACDQYARDYEATFRAYGLLP